jgi:hypothetical protein
MKRLLCFIVALALVAGSYVPPASADVDIGFSFFHSNLSPHGNWFVSANYGRVWQPRIYTAGWNPYHDGRWVYTDVGWTWVSAYRWGAVPYHYGTWALDPGYGWVWVPGNVWAPSWVVFRTGPGYVGWAPVPVGFSLNASFRFGNDGYYDDYGYGYDYDPSMFIFVGDRDFLAPRIRERVVPVYRVRTILPQTTVLNTVRIENNIVVNTGPDVRTIERSTGVRVQQQPIERVQRVAPTTRVRREQLRVDATRASASDGPIRATAPVDQPRAQGLPPGARERRSGPPSDPRSKGPRRAEPETTAPDRTEQLEQQRRQQGEERSPAPQRAEPEPRTTPPERRVEPQPDPAPRPQAKAKQQPEPSPRPQAKAKQPPAPTQREQAAPPAQPTPQPEPDSRATAKAKEQEQKAKAKKKAAPKKKPKDEDDKDSPTS